MKDGEDFMDLMQSKIEDAVKRYDVELSAQASDGSPWSGVTVGEIDSRLVACFFLPTGRADNPYADSVNAFMPMEEAKRDPETAAAFLVGTCVGYAGGWKDCLNRQRLKR